MSELPTAPESWPLGRTDLRISPMAWGMWRLTKSAHDVGEASRLVHAAVDAGITLLDIADIYGFNGTDGFGAAEELLGGVLTSEPALRDRIVLATKGGIRPPLPYDQSADYLHAAIDASLRRLRTDVIDLYQLHRPDILAHPQEVARVLDDAVAAGKIRALGVSNFTVHQIAALDSFLGMKLVTTQPEISALRIDCLENGELDQAMMLGLRPLAWSPLAGGELAQPTSERAVAVVAALDAVAAAHEVDRTVAAYSWLLAHPAGIVPIIGSQNPARIAHAVRACGLRWNRKDWYAVLTAARGKRLP